MSAVDISFLEYVYPYMGQTSPPYVFVYYAQGTCDVYDLTTLNAPVRIALFNRYTLQCVGVYWVGIGSPRSFSWRINGIPIPFSKGDYDKDFFIVCLDDLMSGYWYRGVFNALIYDKVIMRVMPIS